MYYLGVDLGGTNIKAALVDADGAIIKEASTPTKLPRPLAWAKNTPFLKPCSRHSSSLLPRPSSSGIR